jgi:hypothetical protein
MSEICGPVLVRRRQAAEALRWEPGDLEKAGAMIGWLMARDADFCHPGPGTGDDTCLAFRYRGTWTGALARPGDWVVLEAGEFCCYTPDRYEDVFTAVRTGDRP